MRFIEETGINATLQDISQKQVDIETKINPIINKGKQDERQDGQTIVGH